MFNEIQTQFIKSQQFLMNVVDINTQTAKNTVTAFGKFANLDSKTDTYLSKVNEVLDTVAENAKKAIQFEVTPIAGYKK